MHAALLEVDIKTWLDIKEHHCLFGILLNGLSSFRTDICCYPSLSDREFRNRTFASNSNNNRSRV